MRIYGPTWADSLRNLQYPFAVPGPVRASDGTVLDPDVITDLALFVSAAVTKVYLYQVTVVQGSSATFTFADNTGKAVGTAVVLATTADRVGVSLNGVNAGFMTFGAVAMRGVLNWAPATYTFRTEIVPHVLVFSDPAWRRGLVLPDGTVLTGTVWVVGAAGIQLEPTATGFAVQAYGDPYAGRAGSRRTYTKIGNVSPDADGNINLVPQGTQPQFRLNVVPLGSGQVRIEVIG